MFFKRPGGQMQFSRKGEAAPTGRSALQEVQRWISASPAEDHGVANSRRAWASANAASRGSSGRRSEVTPAAWVEDVRVAAARRLLEAGDAAPKQVAYECGFADADTLRRAFQRQVGITPAKYRKRFGAASVSPE